MNGHLSKPIVNPLDDMKTMAESSSHKPTDVRMKGFPRRWPVAQCLDWIDAHTVLMGTEDVDLQHAATRILAASIVSPVEVPHFTRSMMDGFALRAEDTSGASPYQSLELTIIGESLPGKPFDGIVQAGQTVRIMTGAPLPNGADAVLPAEYVQIQNDTILAQGETSLEKHIGFPGEDIQQGDTVLESGRALRPQDLGVLSSIGRAVIPVYQKPRVRLIVTGDELLPPGSPAQPHCIADANSPMLQALIQRDGGTCVHPGILPDNPDSIRAAMLDQDADMILVSGGSSVGQEDHAPQLLAELGSLDIHGIAIRPSSPTGMGMLGNLPVFLLPGNPVSCLCAYDFFAGRALRQMSGRPTEWPYPAIRLPLKRKLVSAVGRTDYARVQIQDNHVNPIAISGASVLSSTTIADGFVVIEENLEGYARNSEVTVYRYQ